MQLTLSFTETFTSLDAFEVFASRLRAALAGLPVSFAPAPVPATAVPPAAVPASEAAPVSSVPEIASTEAPKSRRGRPSNADKAKAAEAVEAPPAPVEPEAVPVEPEAVPVASGAVMSFEDFRAKLCAIAQESGVIANKVMPSVLSDFSATRFPEVAEVSRAAFIEKLKAKIKEAA